jgi:hypothetical protein
MAALLIGAVGVFADGGALDVTVADKTEYAVDTTTDGAIVEYIGDSNTSFGSAGTGTFGTFLQTQDDPSEEGYNTDGTRQFDTGASPQFNHSILVSEIPTVTCESLDESESTDGLCWELFADINDSNANDPEAKQIQLTELEVWFTDDNEITGYVQAGDAGFPSGADKVYDFEGTIHINDVNQGSGRGDLRYLIPVSGIDLPENCEFGNAACAIYFVVYTEWGDPGDGEWKSDSGFEEWKVKTYPFLSVTKTAETTFTRTFDWDIDKSVVPETWDLFRGDTGTSEYTVEVTKDAGTDSDWAVSGTITIENPSDEDATIESVADEISGVGAITVDCGVVFPYLLADGATLECTYSSLLPDGTDRINTATVTLEAGAVFMGDADITFGDPTTLVNDTINVDDTYAGDLGSFSDSGSTSYDRTFACDADEGTHGNTATIVETGANDSASVEVNCHVLTVTKDADESFDRAWEWTIEKSADQTDLLLAEGQLFQVNYEVLVDATSTDSGYAVEGTITVDNPAPIDAVLTGVSDVVSPAIAADVDCGVTFPYTLIAGGSLECDYSADLPDDADRTNTATATLQNYDYDSEGVGTESGTTDFTGNADVSFDGVIPDETDECIDVSDTNVGFLGTVCADQVPFTFQYSLWFGANPDADVVLECGDNTHPNVASFVTNDTATTGDDDWTVNATVECDVGCTLTQGYWKTHSERGPAPFDDTWALLSEGADTPFYTSGQTWYEVFWTTPKGGNAYYILAHQYEAAVLNQLNGASSTPEVDAALVWADTFFSTHDPDTQLSKAERQEAISYAGILGSYNEGITGPGHCDEDQNSAAFLVPPLLPARRRQMR